MKSKVNEKWIEEKASELYNLLYYEAFNQGQVKDFIRSLVEEIGEDSASNARDAYGGHREDK